MTLICLCCEMPFDENDAKSKRVDRAVSQAAIEATTDPECSETFEAVVVTFYQYPSSHLCSYCHTRITNSREAAEEL